MIHLKPTEGIRDGILSTDMEILEKAFEDVGDISGLTIFDAGPEGVVSRYLAERIGDGRIIGVNLWLEAYRMVRKRVGDELMEKVVFIKDDMQNMDYLKENFFDMVISYDTLISIESMTPGGTLPILRQFYRILKHDGLFLAIEHPALQEIKPVNKAQELELEFRKILNQIRREEFGKGTYMPRKLSDMLRRIGFTEIYWKTVSRGQFATPSEVTGMIEGVKNLANERIIGEKTKETILKQIEDLAKQAEKKVSVNHQFMHYMPKNLRTSQRQQLKLHFNSPPRGLGSIAIH